MNAFLIVTAHRIAAVGVGAVQFSAHVDQKIGIGVGVAGRADALRAGAQIDARLRAVGAHGWQAVKHALLIATNQTRWTHCVATSADAMTIVVWFARWIFACVYVCHVLLV